MSREWGESRSRIGDPLVSNRYVAWSMAGTIPFGIDTIGSRSGCCHKVYTDGASIWVK